MALIQWRYKVSYILNVNTNGVRIRGMNPRELMQELTPSSPDYGKVKVGTDGTIGGEVTLAKDTEATTTTKGLMSAADKIKVDTINNTITRQGNVFNGNSQLVQTTTDGKLPALDGSNLTGITASTIAAGTSFDNTISGLTATNVQAAVDELEGKMVDLTSNQTIAGVKTFSSNPLSTATQSTNSNALTKYSAVVKNTGDETISGVKTFSSSPIVPTATTSTQAVNKGQLDLKANIASPVFTGTPTAPTPSSDDNSAKIATTAFAQPRLVSGTNIKTINSTSILGSGDISISTIPNYSAGSIPDARAGIDGGENYKQNNYSTYIKVREFIVPRSGTITVYFNIWVNDAITGYGRIYKNDVAVGTERTTTSTSPVYFTENITVTAGDKIQLYYRTNNLKGNVRNSLFEIRVSNPLTPINTLIGEM